MKKLNNNNNKTDFITLDNIHRSIHVEVDFAVGIAQEEMGVVEDVFDRKVFHHFLLLFSRPLANQYWNSKTSNRSDTRKLSQKNNNNNNNENNQNNSNNNGNNNNNNNNKNKTTTTTAMKTTTPPCHHTGMSPLWPGDALKALNEPELAGEGLAPPLSALTSPLAEWIRPSDDVAEAVLGPSLAIWR
jgi:hypothetical protein